MISNELRQEVLEKVRECKVIAKQKLNLELPPLTITFDLTGHRAGEAWSTKNKIRFNEDYLNRFSIEMIAQTIPHEVAHIVADHYYHKFCHHNRLWVNIMINVYDRPPKRTHDFGAPLNGRIRKTKIYKLQCSNCNFIHTFGKIWRNRIVINGTTSVSCAKCRKYFSDNDKITLDIG